MNSRTGAGKNTCKIAIAASVLLWTLGACRSPLLGGDPAAEAVEGARQRAAEVEELARRGKFGKAERLVLETLAETAEVSRRAAAADHFTLGWLYAERAQAKGDPRSLEAAEREYRAVLELEPGHPQATLNLAFVLAGQGRGDDAIAVLEAVLASGRLDSDDRYEVVVTIGDLHSVAAGAARRRNERGSREAYSAALARYDEAFALDRADGTAPLRIVGLAVDLGGSIDLEARCREFVDAGVLEAALRGYGHLISGAVEDGNLERAAAWLEIWVELAARLDALFPAALESLPTVDEWNRPPRSASLIRPAGQEDPGRRPFPVPAREPDGGPDRLGPNRQDGGADQPRRAREELDLLMSGAFEGPEQLEYWTATPLRRYRLARALQALAERELLDSAAETDAERLAYAESLLLNAIREAPAAEAYPLDDPEGLEIVRTDVGLDAALDYAVFLYTYPEQDPGRGKLDALTTAPRESEPIQIALAREELGGGGQLTRESFEAVPRRDREKEKYHVVLGLIFDALDDLELARFHLEQSIQRAEGAEEMVPSLHRRLGRVYADSRREILEDGRILGDPVASLDSYYTAAEGFLTLDSRRNALLVLEDARGVTKDYRDNLSRRIRAIDRLLFPVEGWYVGGSVGITDLNASADELRDALGLDDSQVAISMDDQSVGGKAFAQYRFNEWLSAELGITWLGGPESTIEEKAANAVDPDEVEAEHPIAGRGPTLALEAYPYRGETFTGSVKLGAWYWWSDVDVSILLDNGTVTEFTIDENGVDPFAGIGGRWRLANRLFLRGEWERYWLDGDTADLISIGLMWHF